MKNIIAISSDFLTAFAALPKSVQNKTTAFVNKFKNNPKASGIHYEKINNTIDKKICSVRIDDTYRGIVVREETEGVYLLLWVDHHDEAYAWAARKKCEVNPVTGNVQVFDVQFTEQIENEKRKLSPGIFEKYKDEDLIRIGVPQEQLSFVKQIAHLSDFYQSKGILPEDAYENLEWLANDLPLEELIEMLDEMRKVKKAKDLAEAIVTDESKKSFVVVTDDAALLQIMSAPLEKWRVFLHPVQRKIVDRQYNGPTRILGGAGTGKTVVAMHRAKMLANQISEHDTILFTTYTRNLAADIRSHLKKICTRDEISKISVINLDAWVAQFLKENEFDFRIKYDEELEEIWRMAISRSGEDLGFGSQFYLDEWRNVVASQDAYDEKEYLKASRIGRGTRLDRKKRKQVWDVFNEYMTEMNNHQLRDVDWAMYECRQLLQNRLTEPLFSHIIVDEGQDFSPNAYKLLRTMAGKERENDIFIVGDAHQRIYKNKASLSKCGINIRGRSSRLKINYRTTDEIRRYAFSLLKGLSFDDLDENYDDGQKCISLTHGVKPQVQLFNHAGEEISFIIKQIKALLEEGENPNTICVVARTNKIIKDYTQQFIKEGLQYFQIKRDGIDDQSQKGIRMATMHRVKGLEFKTVFIVSANYKVIPLSVAIDHTDKTSELTSLTAEKSLLYVAITRAQKMAYMTGYGKMSELISTSIEE